MLALVKSGGGGAVGTGLRKPVAEQGRGRG
jgi:hypothetical protein